MSLFYWYLLMQHSAKYAAASQNSIWKCILTPDDGIRLFSKTGNCYLGTTFRTFPDPKLVNDTGTLRNPVDQGINLELEAACIKEANLASSTFYVIDGGPFPSSYIEMLTNPGLGKLPKSFFRSGIVWRGWEMISAMYRLRNFRRYYGDWHDFLKSMSDQELFIPQPRLSLFVDISFVLLIALNLLNDRRLRRWGPLSTLKPKLEKGNSLSLSNFGVVFAVLHLGWYTAWGETRVYGNRVAFVVTLISWSSLIQGVVEEWQQAGTSFTDRLREEESEEEEIADEKPVAKIKGKKKLERSSRRGSKA